MIKVLHVIRSLDRSIGGPVTGLRNLVSAQSKSGDVIPSIFSTRTGNDTFVQDYDCETNVLNAPLFFSKLNNNFRFFLDDENKLEKLIRGSDIVHLHMAWDYVVLKAATLSLALGKPAILRPCGSFEKWSMSQKYLKKRMYLSCMGKNIQSVSALHFTTPSEERQSSITESWTNGRYIIPLGVKNTELKNEEFLKRAKNIKSGKINLLFLGRLNYKKQPEKVLYTLKYLRGNSTNEFFVRFVGSGSKSYLESLKALSKRLGVDDAVTFVGPADSTKINKEIGSAHFFLLPSLQENLSIATIEAMSLGLPVIISDCVAIHPDVSDYSAGVIVSHNQEHFGQEILEVLHNDKLYKRMCINSAKLVSEKFEINKNTRDITNMYRDLFIK